MVVIILNDQVQQERLTDALSTAIIRTPNAKDRADFIALKKHIATHTISTSTVKAHLVNELANIILNKKQP